MSDIKHKHIDSTLHLSLYRISNTLDNSEFYKQPIFYAIGHFSKFIPPNSKRIYLNVMSLEKTLDAVGFIRPDGTIVVIIFNR